MKFQDIFCLVVRLSGFFFTLFAGYLTLQLLIAPMSYGTDTIMQAGATALFGAAIMRLAPLIGAFAYPEDKKL